MLKTGMLALVGSLALAAPVFADEEIAITGEGMVSAAPDIAMIRIGVESREADAAKALSANSAQAGALIEAAKSRGVEPKDIQTVGLNLFPVYDNGYEKDSRLEGFQAVNEVVIRLRDISGVGETLGALVEAGANRINGISFGIADDEKLMDEARKRAVADATRKAEIYAEAAGVKLGEVTSIIEQGGGMAPRLAMRAMADSAKSVPVEAGEATVSASVRITWEIEDGK